MKKKKSVSIQVYKNIYLVLLCVSYASYKKRENISPRPHHRLFTPQPSLTPRKNSEKLAMVLLPIVSSFSFSLVSVYRNSGQFYALCFTFKRFPTFCKADRPTDGHTIREMLSYIFLNHDEFHEKTTTFASKTCCPGTDGGTVGRTDQSTDTPSYSDLRSRRKKK